jgi:hypothetical protein
MHAARAAAAHQYHRASLQRSPQAQQREAAAQAARRAAESKIVAPRRRVRCVSNNDCAVAVAQSGYPYLVQLPADKGYLDYIGGCAYDGDNGAKCSNF